MDSWVDQWKDQLMGTGLCVALLSTEGVIEQLSPALSTLLRVDENEAKGRSFQDVFSHPLASLSLNKDNQISLPRADGQALRVVLRLTKGLGSKLMIFVEDRTELETSKTIVSLFARASEEIGTSLDERETIQCAAELPTGLLCDWAAVLLVDDSGRIQFKTCHHFRKNQEADLCEYLRLQSEEFVSIAQLDRVIQRGEPQLNEVVIDGSRAQVLAVPLIVRHDIVGVYCMGGGKEFTLTPEHAFIAQEVASRTAAALENAFLYSRAREVELELTQAKQNAEEASRTKTNFLANMSHEIRTPLGGVLGFVDLLLSEGERSPAQEEWATRIRHNGDHLLRLINDILDLSKVESGKLDLCYEDVCFQSLLQDLFALLKARASSKGLALTMKFETPVPIMLRSDSTRLHQILTNLIGNALKFTDKGGVDVALKFRDRILTVDVRDTGPGLTIDQASRLFVPFTQGDLSHTRRFGGTGLGLALSRHLAQLLGGDLELLYTEPGKGTCFRFELPLDQAFGEGTFDKLESSNKPAESRPNASIRGRLTGRRLLLVDDSEDNRLFISRILMIAGAEVDVAPEGKTGIEMALASSYSAVLMDIQMPGIDGIEATRELRRMGYRPPIIALTAHALLIEKERCLAAGCNSHVTKPVDKVHLVETITQLTRPFEAHPAP